METLLLDGMNKDDIAKAGSIIRSGGLVAIPTETVYGLAANALEKGAVKKIYEAKGRPSDNPLIVHISHISQLSSLVTHVPESARKLAEIFWPGPLTIILPRSEKVPEEVSGGLDTVSVRLPAHPIAKAVIEAAGVPLAAPSANVSGRPSPTSFSHVKEDLFGRVDALLDGGDCGVGVESTVLTLVTDIPRVLRPGGVTVEQLREVLGEVEVDRAVTERLGDGEKAASPGMKYKHYSPKADVVLVAASPEEYESYVNSREGCCALCFDEDLPYIKGHAVSYGSRYDSEEQAKKLFYALHDLDKAGVKKAYAAMPKKNGVGLAVYNRLIRCAGFDIIRPREHMIIGLVGSSGSGKTTVASAFSELGAAVIDCDKLTRSSEVYNTECIRALSEAFGGDIVTDTGFNRRLVAERAFSSPEAKKLLESITFPRIIGALRKKTEELVAEGKKIIMLDAPTLFEAGIDRMCEKIVFVRADKELRLKRIISRDGITEQEALRRFSAQHDDEFYRTRSDYIIENGDGSPVEDKALCIMKELRGEIYTV